MAPPEVVARNDPRHRLAARLCVVKLRHPAELDGERGYVFHEWTEYQPTRSEVEERRAARAEAGRLGGLKAAQTRRARAGAAQANGQVPP